MPTSRLRLGQLLVDARMLTAAALEEVLVAQRTDGRRLGTLLVERGLINETQLTQILSHQLSVPWVSLLHIEFSRQLLNLVPREVADKYCLVPIYVRHVRNQGDALYVAMDDPSNEEGLRACSAHAGLPVRAMIAPPSDIRGAIRVYYGVPSSGSPLSIRSEDASRSTPPSTDPLVVSTKREPKVEVDSPALPASPASPASPAPPAPVAPVAPVAADVASTKREPAVARAASGGTIPPISMEAVESLPPTRVEGARAEIARAERGSEPTIESQLTLPPPESAVESSTAPRTATGEVDNDAPQIETIEIEIPAPRGRAPKMVALTLLDGTTIQLPARRQRRALDTAIRPAAGSPASPGAAGASGASNASPIEGLAGIPRVGSADDDAPPESQDVTLTTTRPTTAPPSSDDPLHGLTARDLVLALRVVANGADASEVLGENVRWEALFSALLSLLLKKHLIADWEFVDELKKQL